MFCITLQKINMVIGKLSLGPLTWRMVSISKLTMMHTIQQVIFKPENFIKLNFKGFTVSFPNPFWACKEISKFNFCTSDAL